MKLEIQCPHCKKQFHVNEKCLKKYAKCTCGHVFKILSDTGDLQGKSFASPDCDTPKIPDAISETTEQEYTTTKKTLKALYNKIGLYLKRLFAPENYIFFEIAFWCLLIIAGLVLCYIYLNCLFYIIIILGFIIFLKVLSLNAEGEKEIKQKKENAHAIIKSLEDFKEFRPDFRYIYSFHMELSS